MSTALAGTLYATIDGKSYAVAGKGMYRVSSGGKRESLMGQDGYHGFSEMPTPGKITWEGRDSSNVSTSAMSSAAGVTIVLSLANGKTIIGQQMVRIGDAPIEVNTEDGTFPVEFEGPDVSEN